MSDGRARGVVLGGVLGGALHGPARGGAPRGPAVTTAVLSEAAVQVWRSRPLWELASTPQADRTVTTEATPLAGSRTRPWLAAAARVGGHPRGSE